MFNGVNVSLKMAADRSMVSISLNMPATEKVTTEVSDIKRNSAISIKNAKHPPNRIIATMLSVDPNVRKNGDCNMLSIPSIDSAAMNNEMAINGDKNKFV